MFLPQEPSAINTCYLNGHGISIKFHGETKYSDYLSMSWGKLSRHAQNLIARVNKNNINNPPCPITPTSRHHLYIIHLINGLHYFYCITMSRKWPLLPKSNVKHYFSCLLLLLSDNFIIKFGLRGPIIQRCRR